MHPSVYKSIIYSWQDMEASQVPINRLKKMWDIYIYIHNGMKLSHEKNGILPSAATGMDLENTAVSGVNQKSKYCVFIYTCGIQKS